MVASCVHKYVTCKKFNALTDKILLETTQTAILSFIQLYNAHDDTDPKCGVLKEGALKHFVDKDTTPTHFLSLSCVGTHARIPHCITFPRTFAFSQMTLSRKFSVSPAQCGFVTQIKCRMKPHT